MDGQPISVYISELTNIRSQFVGTDQAIDDATFKDQLLSSLPESYNVLVEIIHEREEDISVVETIRKVQQNEIAQQKKYGSTSFNTSGSSSQALYSNRGKGGPIRSETRRTRSTNPYIPKPAFSGNCYNCGKTCKTWGQ